MSTILRIINNNSIDDPDITLSVDPSVISTLPVANLQDPARSKVMRTDPLTAGGVTTEQKIKMSWADPKAFNACALIRHNLSYASQWKIEIFTADDWTGSAVYDSGAINCVEAIPFGDLIFGVTPLGVSVFQDWDSAFSVNWFDMAVGQSAIITLYDDNISNPDDYMELSRVIFGTYLEPELTASFGMDLAWKENTKQTRSAGGTLRSDPSVAYRAINFKIEHMPEVERHRFLDLFRDVGMRKDFFMSLYPEVGGVKERDHAIHGKLVSMSKFTHNHYNGYVVPFSMEEV